MRHPSCFIVLQLHPFDSQCFMTARVRRASMPCVRWAANLPKGLWVFSKDALSQANSGCMKRALGQEDAAEDDLVVF